MKEQGAEEQIEKGKETETHKQSEEDAKKADMKKKEEQQLQTAVESEANVDAFPRPFKREEKENTSRTAVASPLLLSKLLGAESTAATPELRHCEADLTVPAGKQHHVQPQRVQPANEGGGSGALGACKRPPVQRRPLSNILNVAGSGATISRSNTTATSTAGAVGVYL